MNESQLFNRFSLRVYGRVWHDDVEPKRREGGPPDDELFSVYDICPSCHAGKMTYVKYDHGEIYECERCGAKEKR